MAKIGQPECKITGHDGNIFNLMGIVSRTLKEHDLKEQAEEMVSRVMSKAENYEHALRIMDEYCDLK